MVWQVETENDPSQKSLHVGVNRGPPGDVTSIVSCRGKVLPFDQEDHDAVFAGSDDGFIAMYDERLNFEKDWHGQEHGVNCLAVGQDEKDTTWLYSCSAFGEIKQWWPAALELLYQNTAEHPDTESKGFTSAGGRRDSAVKQLRWCQGSLYSGDDAGVICKWDSMLTMAWSTNVYSTVASLAVSVPSPNLTRLVSGDLVSSQLVVGEVRAGRRVEGGLEVAAMIGGRAPLALSEDGEVAVCTSPQDQTTITIHRHRDGVWGHVASLSSHTDQVSDLAINHQNNLLAAAAWDGRVSIWSLESQDCVGDVKVADYVNCLCWGPSGEVYAGVAAGRIVKLNNI